MPDSDDDDVEIESAEFMSTPEIEVKLFFLWRRKSLFFVNYEICIISL